MTTEHEPKDTGESTQEPIFKAGDRLVFFVENEDGSPKTFTGKVERLSELFYYMSVDDSNILAKDKLFYLPFDAAHAHAQIIEEDSAFDLVNG